MRGMSQVYTRWRIVAAPGVRERSTTSVDSRRVFRHAYAHCHASRIALQIDWIEVALRQRSPPNHRAIFAHLAQALQNPAVPLPSSSKLKREVVTIRKSQSGERHEIKSVFDAVVIADHEYTSANAASQGILLRSECIDVHNDRTPCD